MSVRLYFDVHVRLAVAVGLRLRDVDVLQAQEDGTAEFEDARLLDRATQLDRVLFTQDRDLLREATRRQRAGERFSGIVYAHQLEVSIGKCVIDLEIIAKDSEPDELVGRGVLAALATVSKAGTNLSRLFLASSEGSEGRSNTSARSDRLHSTRR